MKAEEQAAPPDTYIQRQQIAELIRKSFPALRNILPDAYVDGEDVFRALVILGRMAPADGPEIVGEALGWKCLGLPVANIHGKPKFYLPNAVQITAERHPTLTEQVSLFAKNLRASPDCEDS
jgi:hypothetical protein